MPLDHEIKFLVEDKVRGCSGGNLEKSARALLGALGYESPKTIPSDGTVATFLQNFDREGMLQRPTFKSSVDDWEKVDFIFQLTNDELPMLAEGQGHSLPETGSYHRSIIESFVFIAIELKPGDWPRGKLADITRAVNRIFPMPAIIFFRYGKKMTIAVIPRRAHKRDSSRDVIEESRKISLIKDIDLESPHRAHIDIISSLRLDSGISKKVPSTFNELYEAWAIALSAEELNKRFYKDLSNWYLWAYRRVEFPPARGIKDDESDRLNQVSIIRMLTRLIFIWFVKEKGLVPGDFFDRDMLPELLKDDPTKNPDDSSYYLAVLQNLFFATLNTQMGEGRTWRSDEAKKGRTPDYLVSNLFRQKDMFSNPKTALELFRQVPFLNGGLFECLDREVTQDDIAHGRVDIRQLTKEGRQLVFRGDGFSERPESQPTVPNQIFFGSAIDAKELNKELGTKGRTYKVDGLIAIFERYKFTIEENTPLDEEVALDPELLGKVFENLIASYNEDTKTSARKLSGSFYTPRVVVDYMVDEALVGYLTPCLSGGALGNEGKGTKSQKKVTESLDLGSPPGELEMVSGTPQAASAVDTTTSEQRIRNLLRFKNETPDFSKAERKNLIEAIEGLRAIDPACGSGAFPMGLLGKLVHVLGRLDPDNTLWEASCRAPLERQLAEAKKQPDAARRADAVDYIEEELEKLDRDFSENVNYADYSRKLYIIDKCIHGVDIQPIAVQIAKLRFFISLIVSQKIDREAENYNITPLPNLETRLVAANALIPIEKPKMGDLYRNDDIARLEASLKDANERYFGTRTRKSKNKARDEIAALRDELTEALIDTQDLPEEEASKIGRWDPFNQNASAEFFDPEWMFGLGEKFDIVIANPPYIRQEKIDKEQKEFFKAKHNALKKGQGKRDLFLPLGLYQSFTGTADYLVYFIERGLDLLEPGGMFVFITSNKWYRAAYGKNIRLWMSRASKIRNIIDFGDADVFDAIAYPTIIVSNKRENVVTLPGEEIFKAWAWPSDYSRKDIERFPELFRENAFSVPQKSLDHDKGWQLESTENRDLLAQIRGAGTPLGEYVDGQIYYGIKTGFNEAFVIDGETKDRLIAEDPKSGEIIKPFLRGRDIKRWNVVPQDQWLIFTRRGVAIEDYPAIKAYLEMYQDRLTPKPSDWPTNRKWEGRKAGSYEWYEIQDVIGYWQKFEAEKIFTPAIQNKVDYALDDQGYYGNDKTNIIVSNHASFLLGVLNSQVSWWITQQTFSSKQGGFYEFKPMYLETLTVPKVNTFQRQSVATLVDIIRKSEKAAREYQLLNGLVYELFIPDLLNKRGVRLFDALKSAAFEKLFDMKGETLLDEASEFINFAFQPSNEIYRMLFDLRAIDEVRLIEGEE